MCIIIAIKLILFRITSYNVCYTKLLRIINKNNEELFVQFDTLINDISQISRGIN